MRKQGFFAGLLGAAVMVATQFILQFITSYPAPPVMVADHIASLFPGKLFSFFISLLEFAAKPMLLTVVVAAEIALGGVFGLFYARLWDKTVPPFGKVRWPKEPAASRVGVRGGITFAGLIWLAFELLFFPFVGNGPADINFIFPALARGMSLITFGVVLAATYAFLVRPWVERNADLAESKSMRLSRVQLMRLVIGSTAAVAMGGFGMRAAGAYDSRPTTGRRGLTELPPAVTPTPAFYSVSKNFLDPSVDSKTWKLTLTGLVDEPQSLTYRELKLLPARTQPATLLCISNEVGGDLISNGEWTVTSLGDLIAKASPQPGVRDVVLYAADGYTDSIPIGKALEQDCVVAWELNGEPLTAGHGYPARLLVPGIYGMKNVKWLTRIELVSNDFKGFWQTKGWSDDAFIKSMSRIDFPGSGSTVYGPVIKLGGIAFCGDRGVDRVEISTDAGRTWNDATVKAPASKLTWALWTYDWAVPARGEYRVAVRAVDQTGQTQIGTKASSFPNGSAGLHTITLRVADRPTA